MSPSEKQNILLESGVSHLLVRFNRPEIRNPLSVEVLEELGQILDRAAAQKEITKIIFTGAEDVFASGANLNEIAALDSETARGFALRGQALMRKIAAAPQKTIAAVGGYCFGGALDLALACDARVASPGAVFCHPSFDGG